MDAYFVAGCTYVAGHWKAGTLEDQEVAEVYLDGVKLLGVDEVKVDHNGDGWVFLVMPYLPPGVRAFYGGKVRVVLKKPEAAEPKAKQIDWLALNRAASGG